MKRRELFSSAVGVAGALLALACLAPIAPAPAQVVGTLPAPLPGTIPAIQQWQPGTGAFTARRDARIVISTADAPIVRPDASTLAADLRAATDLASYVRIGIAPRPGDIVLDLVPSEPDLRAEGYRLVIGDSLVVEASDGNGVFYGTRTVVQLLRQAPTLPAGTVLDWPRYPDRGVMVDAGRRYYPPAFYRTLIDRMSYLKLNLLHLHISDDAGLGIESVRHPEAVADQYLTKTEVRQLVAYARRQHVRVMPEIDMPGHMTGILADHPELQLVDLTGARSPDRLDVTDPAARAFAKDLLAEMLPLFPGREWHLGADEYLMTAEYALYPSLRTYAVGKYGSGAVSKDALHDFVNEMADFVQARGKVARIWNDEAGGAREVVLDPDIVVEWWTDFSPLSDPLPPNPAALAADGHEVLNNGWWPTYFNGKGLPAPRYDQAYTKWRVADFYGALYYDSTVQLPPKRLPAGATNRGSKLALWGDGQPLTDDEMLSGSLPGIRLIAQKTWASRQPSSYELFLATADAVTPAARP